jgi:hypothetical protein
MQPKKTVHHGITAVTLNHHHHRTIMITPNPNMIIHIITTIITIIIK